jgi:outer membrane protein OmpA-like peptidoglycan-associated protein
VTPGLPTYPRLSIGLALALWAGACVPPARPPALARVAEVRASPAAAEAETWAPQAHAHALELEERAEQALNRGDAEEATLLAESAIAAHEHAWVLTRLARAERRRLEAQVELDGQRRVLEDLRAQHQRLTAEAAALEQRAQVVRSALPLPPHEATAAERQQARRRAAGALSAQARLLCVGAQLLGEGERVQALTRRLDELDQRLAAGTAPTLLETAAELRSDCLRLISDVRHQNTAPAARTPSTSKPASTASPGPTSTRLDGSEEPAPAKRAEGPPGNGGGGAPIAGPLPADVLLDELSAAGAAPSRDDRGVAIALRDLFAADGNLSEPALATLSRFGQIARKYPDYPILLVGHSASARGAPDIERQLARVSTALVGAGASKIATWSVGDREPLLPQRSPAANARNQRIELVFVAPGF